MKDNFNEQQQQAQRLENIVKMLQSTIATAQGLLESLKEHASETESEQCTTRVNKKRLLRFTVDLLVGKNDIDYRGLDTMKEICEDIAEAVKDTEGNTPNVRFQGAFEYNAGDKVYDNDYNPIGTPVDIDNDDDDDDEYEVDIDDDDDDDDDCIDIIVDEGDEESDGQQDKPKFNDCCGVLIPSYFEPRESSAVTKTQDGLTTTNVTYDFFDPETNSMVTINSETRTETIGTGGE